MKQHISLELDELSCDLISLSLDRLAEKDQDFVLCCTEDKAGTRFVSSFEDDDLSICLEEAHQKIKSDPRVERFALAYKGLVLTEGEHSSAEGCDKGALSSLEDLAAYQTALLVEFEEKNLEKAYSAYLLVKNLGQGEKFQWQDPCPAGEIDKLLD